MRSAGGEALSLLAVPLTVQILQSLEEGPKGLPELRQAVGSPAQSTLRHYSRILTERGIIDRHRRPEFHSSTDYEINQAGLDLLGVAAVLQRWLEEAPNGPIRLGSVAWKSATKALVEGWSNNVVRAFASRPLCLTELDRFIPDVTYPSLERRLTAMRLAGLIEPLPREGRGTPYTPTRWLRRGIVPMAAAARWERMYPSEGTQEISRLDVEAAFLLAMPLLEMPSDFRGKCRLAVALQNGDSRAHAGVMVCFEEGKISRCTSRLEGDVEAWAAGPPTAWLKRLSGADGGSLEVGGDRSIADPIVDGIRSVASPPS